MSSASLRAEKANRERELIKVRDDIERLEIAIKAIVVQQEEVAYQNGEVQKRVDCGMLWLGSKYIEYSSYVENTIKSDFEKYLKRIDKSLDDIDKKITKLRFLDLLLVAEIKRLEVAIRIAEAAEAAAAALFNSNN